MARYTKKTDKQSRKVGYNLTGRANNAVNKRPHPIGQHGRERKKVSEYGIQLKEKQKIKWYYGLLEKQFYAIYTKAVHKKGVTGVLMLQMLESRFDNVLFRSGLVVTRRQGRQLIVHGHMLINGQKVDRPSYHMKPGDVIKKKKKSQSFIKLLQDAPHHDPIVPDWIATDIGNLTALMKAVPEREEIDQNFQENLVVEFYSR